MAGKSTMLRMTCAAIIMAQRTARLVICLRYTLTFLWQWKVGCHVPASKARISPIDAIYSRMGANDFIFANASTFKVEMDDTTKILKKVRCVLAVCDWSVHVNEGPIILIGDTQIASNPRWTRSRDLNLRRNGYRICCTPSIGYTCWMCRILCYPFYEFDGRFRGQSIKFVPGGAHRYWYHITLKTTIRIQYHPQ